MKILFYAAAEDPEGPRLRELLTQGIPRANLESYSLLAAMALRLQKTRGDRFLVVVIARDRSHLREIVSWRAAFDGIDLLLVLPDQEEETMRSAHRLHPRYVAHKSGAYADLLAVIRRKLSPESPPRP